MQLQPESHVLTETVEAPTEAPFETKLTQEIAHLWIVHSQAQTILGRTKQELGALRLELGRRLYEMKLLLSRLGRSGGWSKFLSAHRIPRASADRYAKSYEIALNPPAEIASTEAIQDSADETARKILQSIWPRLRQHLTDPDTAYQFVCALVQRCDALRVEISDSGIAVRKPTTINSEPSSDVFDAKNAVEGQGAGHEYE
jgi:hypothetical protein